MEDKFNIEENTKDLENIVALQSEELEKETSDKISTKGLRLKQSTKRRLDELQSKYGDAESMVAALISFHDTLNAEEAELYDDRKVEIEKFNTLMESIKRSYMQSLDIAKYAEEKYIDKFSKEFKKKDKLINDLQEEKNDLKNSIKKLKNNLVDKENEYRLALENFTHINKALSTVEKELEIKTEALNNSQEQVTSLLQVVNENANLKNEIKELNTQINESANLKEKLTVAELSSNKYKEDKENLKELTLELKEEINTVRAENKDLNNKIQELLLTRNEEINNLKEVNFDKLEQIKESYNNKLEEKDAKISKLIEELTILKNERIK